MSVDAFQERSTSEADFAFATRLLGTEGGESAGGSGVLTVAGADWDEVFRAKSNAATV